MCSANCVIEVNEQGCEVCACTDEGQHLNHSIARTHVHKPRNAQLNLVDFVADAVTQGQENVEEEAVEVGEVEAVRADEESGVFSSLLNSFFG